MNILKDTPNAPTKSEYVAFVHARVNQDAIARTGDQTIALKEWDVEARKLFIYSFSLPFWAAMPTVCDDAAFHDLLRFVTAQDMVVVPDSMFNAFYVSRYMVENIL